MAFVVGVRAHGVALPQRHPCRRNAKVAVVAQRREVRDEGEKGGLGRAALSVLATAGLGETGFLSLSLSNNGLSQLPFCGAEPALSTCGSVLTGPFSSIPVPGVGGEVPLLWLGVGAYSALLVLSLLPRSIPKIEDSILALTTALSAAEAGLIFILTQKLHANCFYCVTSALIAWTSWAVAVAGAFSNRTYVKALRSMLGGLAIAAVVGVTAASAGGGADAPVADEVLTHSPPPITSESTVDAMELGHRLQDRGARLFGAYWCNHCFSQKELLGKEAFGLVEYIECAKDGDFSQYKYCREREIPGYPTWEIGGELYPGEQDIQELNDIVDFL